MKKSTKHFLLAIGFTVAAYVIYSVYKVIAAGVTDAESILTAPFTLASDVYNAISGTISNAVYNPNVPTPVTAAAGDLAPALGNAGVTDAAAPDTAAQVAAFKNETADQKAAGVNGVTTWDVVKSWF